MIEKLYFFYREYGNIMFKIMFLVIIVSAISSLIINNEQKQKKIAGLTMLIVFPIIMFNVWIVNYKYKFGREYAILVLNNEKKLEIIKDSTGKKNKRRDISFRELSELIEEEKLVTVMMSLDNDLKYKFSYVPRPEEYRITQCKIKKCIIIGAIKQKEFLILVNQKIKVEDL